MATKLRDLPLSIMSDVEVDAAAVGTGAITTDKLAANAVTTAKIANDQVTGAKATANQRGKPISSPIPTVVVGAGTTEVLVIVPFAGTLASARMAFKDALAAHDTNFVTFAIVNKGLAGAGATAMLAATDANTTKATGGTAIAAYGSRSLTLHGTGANLVVAGGDVLAVQATVSGTLANELTEGHVRLVIDTPG